MAMGRMIFDLTDEQRVKLEQLRASMGLRSQAETLRTLIELAVPPVVAQLSAEDIAKLSSELAHGPGGAAIPPPSPPKVDVPLFKPGVFRPMPKSGKRK